MPCENPKTTLGIKGRSEEREALNVVPVGVGKKEGALTLVITQQRRAKRPDAGPRIKDEALISHGDFDTGGVTPVAKMRLRGTSNTASYAPKGYLHETRAKVYTLASSEQRKLDDAPREKRVREEHRGQLLIRAKAKI